MHQMNGQLRQPAGQERLRVLCLLSDFEGNGGIHRFNRNLVQAICGQGSHCEVLTLNDTGTGEVFKGHAGHKVQFMLAALAKARSFQPDFIIIGLLNFAPLALLRLLCRGRVAIILHGFEAWYRRGKLAPFFPWVDKFWAVSEYTRRKFALTNGVDPARVERIFNTIPADWERGDFPVSYQSFFLSITRLDKGEMYKGIDKSIQAISEIKELLRSGGWEYRLVAHGNDLERHKAMVRELHVEDLVKFQTNLTDRDLKSLYADCSFFLLPSSGEGFGIVFLEAMAYRKACIGAAGCGTDDVIAHGQTGFLIEPTAGNIRDCLLRLTSDPVMCSRMGEAGYQRLNTTFSFFEFKNKISNLLNNK
jgi:glycosyltransferase involved in cell wall biosynthesis